MNTPLAELQRDFLSDVRGSRAGAASRMLADGGIPVERGIAIYRNAYVARLRETLENDHEALGRYLGDDGWDLLCAGYLAEHPSRLRSLRGFGDALPAYLAHAAAFRETPQVSELAMLERLFLACFDAADAEAADWASLMALPETVWPMLSPRFQPSLRSLACRWNTLEIWSALKAGAPPPDASPVASHWLLYRDRERVTRFRSMAEDEARLLAHFLDGGDFAGGCNALLGLHPMDDVPAVAVGLLGRWCEESLVVRWR